MKTNERRRIRGVSTPSIVSRVLAWLGTCVKQGSTLVLRRVHVYVSMVIIEYVSGAQRGLRRLLGLPITRTVANFLVDVHRLTTGKRNRAILWQETFATLKYIILVERESFSKIIESIEGNVSVTLRLGTVSTVK